jgi:hypothetical protein
MPGKNERLGKIQTLSGVFRTIGTCRAGRKEQFFPFGYGVSAQVEGPIPTFPISVVDLGSALSPASSPQHNGPDSPS